jgi:hypothetical protein
MQIYEITGFDTGISRAGVNYLQPADSFQNIQNGFINRQVLQSRKGFQQWSLGYNATRHLKSRVLGIFQNILTDINTYETLAVDKDNLYRYNETTNAFDLIPFGGSLAAVTSFGIASNEYYVTGTTYPFGDGTNRFVFTGKGMSKVYFYDGTNVLDYTDGGVGNDNPDYVAFAGTNIINAVRVFWFGERLNFIAPLIGSQEYPQGMLYSAIRTASGNGDNYNFSGAGLLQIDTYEHIIGAAILGDKIVLNVNKSNWLIEKTKDAFNPYFSRKIPSVLGTDAAFSPVVWNGEVRSLGKTGIIMTDGRQSTRVDNKIPYFTQDDIDSNAFELTYGGFDRSTSQFLWAYLSNPEDPDEVTLTSTQDKVLAYNYDFPSYSVYDMRFSVFGESINGQNLSWDDIHNDTGDHPEWATWDETEDLWDKIGLSATVQKTLAGDDLGFIYELDRDFDDYRVEILAPGISNAANAVITTYDHAFIAGDTVILEGVVGMLDQDGSSLNGIPTLVTATTANTITIDQDTTDFTAWTSDGYVSKPINFYAETIPFNPYRPNGLKVQISHIEFLIDNNGASLLVDIFMDGSTSPFKENIMLATSGGYKEREWLTISVNNTCDFMTLKMKQESASTQIRITSIRIHCKPGGYSNG